MSTRRRWWAVWLSEYPEEGSIHVRATSQAGAIASARRCEAFSDDPDEGPALLQAGQATRAVHAVWLESTDADWMRAWEREAKP